MPLFSSTSTQSATDRRRLMMQIGFIGLIPVCGIWFLCYHLNRPSLEDQIVGSAMDRPGPMDVLTLIIQRDGQIRWPDGRLATTEESAVLIPHWFVGKANPVLTIYAPRNASYARLLPLMDAAKKFGSQRVILAVADESSIPPVDNR